MDYAVLLCMGTEKGREVGLTWEVNAGKWSQPWDSGQWWPLTKEKYTKFDLALLKYTKTFTMLF